jgi:hypothetical protein
MPLKRPPPIEPQTSHKENFSGYYRRCIVWWTVSWSRPPVPFVHATTAVLLNTSSFRAWTDAQQLIRYRRQRWYTGWSSPSITRFNVSFRLCNDNQRKMKNSVKQKCRYIRHVPTGLNPALSKSGRWTRALVLALPFITSPSWIIVD